MPFSEIYWRQAALVVRVLPEVARLILQRLFLCVSFDAFNATLTASE